MNQEIVVAVLVGVLVLVKDCSTVQHVMMGTFVPVGKKIPTMEHMQMRVASTGGARRDRHHHHHDDLHDHPMQSHHDRMMTQMNHGHEMMPHARQMHRDMDSRKPRLLSGSNNNHIDDFEFTMNDKRGSVGSTSHNRIPLDKLVKLNEKREAGSDSDVQVFEFEIEGQSSGQKEIHTLEIESPEDFEFSYILDLINKGYFDE